MDYFDRDGVQDLANRIAADLSDKFKAAASSDAALRSALKELNALVENTASRQIETERALDRKARRKEIDAVQAAWDADVRGRSEYLTRIERRRAHLHSALLKVNLRLASIVGMCGDDELKAAILDVQADIKSAIDKQTEGGAPT